MNSVAFEDVAGIDFVGDGVEGSIVAVCNNGIAHRFEFIEVVDNKAAEKVVPSSRVGS